MSRPVHVLIARTEDLGEDVRAAIIDVCVEAHDEADFHNLFTYIPSGGLHFLAYNDSVLVSHAVVTMRWLQPEGLPLLRTAYVDAVATLPEYQGQGYGGAVIRRLPDDLGEYQIACLETELPGFYARLGWEEWRGPLAGRNADGLIETPEQTGIMVLRLPHTPALDLDGSLVIQCDGDRIW